MCERDNKDVPFTTDEWKDTIRKKRKYSKRFAKNPSYDNLNLNKK